MQRQIAAIMTELGISPPAGIVPGTISMAETTFAEPSAALAAFLAPAGQGWLCVAEARDILAGTAKHIRGACPENAFPLWGELALDGVDDDPPRERSLHLRQDGDGWKLVSLVKLGTEKEEDFLLETALLGRHGQCLRYLVEYRGQDCHGLRELRPRACMFLGFSPLQGE